MSSPEAAIKRLLRDLREVLRAHPNRLICSYSRGKHRLMILMLDDRDTGGLIDESIAIRVICYV